MIFSRLFAMIDMSGNLAMAGCVLAIGVILVRLVSPVAVHSKSQIWVPLIALIAGPLVSLFFILVDAFVISPGSYLFASDYLDTIPPVLMIGTFVGVIAALAFAIAYRVGKRKNH